jgi:hypothetical protein
VSPVDRGVFVGVCWLGDKGSGVAGDESDNFASGCNGGGPEPGRWGCAATTEASRSRFANELPVSSGDG